MAARIRSRGRPTDIWPGFVDALAALLVVIIFLLVVFVLAQTFLSQALTGRDEALERLSSQVNELSELLSLERDENAELRVNIAQLSASLQQANEDRDDLVLQLGEVTSQNDALAEQVDVLLARAEAAEGKLGNAEETVTTDRDSIRAQLSQIESLRRDIEALSRLRVNLELQIASLAASLEESDEALVATRDEAQGLRSALDTAETETEDLKTSSASLQARLDAAAAESEELRTLAASLRAQLEAAAAEANNLRVQSQDLRAQLDTSLDDSAQALLALSELEATASSLRNQSAEFETALAGSRSALGALRDRTKELEARLATEEERTLLAQKEVESRDVRLAELQALYLSRNTDLDEQRNLSTQASERVQALVRQVNALRQQLLSLQQALQTAEVRDEEQQIVISSLGERLNRALAARVEELSRYRSEFFGRLREVLGDRQDIQIVGDRFVFQSEVLFNSGSADLEDEGKLRLADLADTLLEISPNIPGDIPWILRVDGHTDSVPINTVQFPSNWELSSARAISVVQFLMERGISADRLAAAGFGQFQPLDAGDDEIANRRNRRIELKLTER